MPTPKRTVEPLMVTDHAPTPAPWAVKLARIRTPMLTALLTTLVLSITLNVVDRWTPPLVGIIASLVSLAVLLLLLVVYPLQRFGAGPRPPARIIASPVSGRWKAIATPAHRVPSHSTHLLAQTYAIDMFAEPVDASRPPFALTGWTRPATDFPAHGAPVRASADAVVVYVDDGQRDHRSRNSWTTLPYLFAEQFVRGFFGYRLIFGNHLVLDLGDGTYLAYAHLKRDSITVAVGDRVHTGQVIAACGNSGNSSEPHLHLQLMDDPSITRAAGLPFAFADTTLEGDGGQRHPRAVVPGVLQCFAPTGDHADTDDKAEPARAPAHR